MNSVSEDCEMRAREIRRTYELMSPSFANSIYTCVLDFTDGWFGKEHNDTEALRRVQVVNGVRTRPFQIRRLLSCLRLSCDQFEVAPRQRFVIMLIGDSTVVQLFWALFCALNRIGGVVHECIQEPKSHYEHPSCERRTLEWTKTTGLQIMASVQVGGTLYVLKHVHEKDDRRRGASIASSGCVFVRFIQGSRRLSRFCDHQHRPPRALAQRVDRCGRNEELSTWCFCVARATPVASSVA